MKFRPILFSAPMVRAIRAGRKTQTRRVVKPQPRSPNLGSGWTGIRYFSGIDGRAWSRDDGDGPVRAIETSDYPYLRASWHPGDYLWVREALAAGPLPEHHPCHPHGECALYEADGQPVVEEGGPEDNPTPEHMMWTGERSRLPAIFMPRKASRLTLEVTDVRVERLQEITEEDAKAEGMDTIRQEIMDAHEGVIYGTGLRYSEHFRHGWDELHAKRPERQWSANPYVFVISFRRTE